ncbi:MAG: hypothetical protein A3A51_00390 [Candidatus Levybacteria bacterium RIFCSPLOWO2_01_FULL_39_10]|nr:MAG: hypothetical protein A3A51_00390 [Candidatus Levybacteria bacterium RIFCSPLOWO2_01_FULL_39_10]
MKIKYFFKDYLAEISVFIFGLLFGGFLMFSSFTSNENSLLISSKAWSDFSSHIPLIRSFSLGANFPPQYPLFPGEPINYHFLFYAFVGLLEKTGLPIGLALNIPSLLGFSFLLLMIYLLANLLFKSKSVGIISVIFFLFNSSLSYYYYFEDKSASLQSFLQIPNITDFQSFAPYGDGIISAFWNLNIYTNQRHLALSFALSLFIVYFLIKPIFNNEKSNIKLGIVLGAVLGLSFFLHLAVFFMTAVVVIILGILFSKIRKSSFIALFVSAIIALPQYLYVSSGEGYNPQFVLGYLLSDNLSFSNFSEFWIFNLGLSIILIPLGFLLSDSKQKRILVAFFSLFIIGNVIQFSPEIAANHKFFNYFLLVGNMFSAYVLLKLWHKKNFLKPVVVVLFLLMVFGGIIDFFPIYNDGGVTLVDYKRNDASSWILKNTSPDSVFLNTSFLYNPASLVGRKIFLGWPYFAWSQGYDTNKRGEIMRSILGANEKSEACDLLKENNIDYIEIKRQNPPDLDIPPISNIFEKEFENIYVSKNEDTLYFDVNTSCRNL